MTLSFDCVSYNYPETRLLAVGSTMLVREGNKTLSIKRVTSAYCKVREVYS